MTARDILTRLGTFAATHPSDIPGRYRLRVLGAATEADYFLAPGHLWNGPLDLGEGKPADCTITITEEALVEVAQNPRAVVGLGLRRKIIASNLQAGIALGKVLAAALQAGR